MEDREVEACGGETPDSESMSGSWNRLYDKYRSDVLEEPVPNGWQTVYQIAKKVGRTTRAVRMILKRAVENGDVEEGYFRVRQHPTSSIRRVTHFRQVDHGEAKVSGDK